MRLKAIFPLYLSVIETVLVSHMNVLSNNIITMQAHGVIIALTRPVSLDVITIYDMKLSR